MKLLNNTPIPSEVLEPLLTKAGRSVGARTSGVVVQVNRASWRYSCSGMAYDCTWVRWMGDNKRKRWARRKDGRLSYPGKRPRYRRIHTDGGAFKIVLPVIDPKRRDPLVIAEEFLYVARHEWGHIRDYQSRIRLPFSRTYGAGRRPAHDKRPEEVRTENYIYESDKRRKAGWADDEVLTLALALEQRAKK